MLLLALILARPALATAFTLKDSIAITVTTTATPLATGVGYTFVEVCNTDTSATLRVGFSAALTAANGRPVQPSTCIKFANLQQAQSIYGIVVTGSLIAIITKGFDPGP